MRKVELKHISGKIVSVAPEVAQRMLEKNPHSYTRIEKEAPKPKKKKAEPKSD